MVTFDTSTRLLYDQDRNFNRIVKGDSGENLNA